MGKFQFSTRAGLARGFRRHLTNSNFRFNLKYVSDAGTQLFEAFARVGLRQTPQRFDVLAWLVKHKRHATAAEIFQAVNRNNHRLSRATVYNALHALVESGLVRPVAGEGASARFDATLDRHHHFICDRCGSIEDLAWFDLPAKAMHAAAGDRAVREVEITFHGTCERCARANAKQSPHPRKNLGERTEC